MQAKNNKKIISISKLFTSIENNQKFSWNRRSYVTSGENHDLQVIRPQIQANQTSDGTKTLAGSFYTM
jgi:hypothetical protein